MWSTEERKPSGWQNVLVYRGLWESMYQSRKGLYQWVLLSWAEVKGRLVEHLHKVLQAGHIHFILHRLPKTHKHKHMSPHAELHPLRAQQHTNHSRVIHLVTAKWNTFRLCFCSNFHKLHLKPLDKTCTIMNSAEESPSLC